MHILISLIFSLFFFMTPLEARPIQIALSSAPLNLSPLHATDGNSQNINRLVYLSLVDVNEQMKIVCRSCESFREYNNEKNEHIIHFKLKQGLSFHDGTPINAHSIYKSWKIFTDEKRKSVFKRAFDKISRIEILSNLELEIVYAQFDLENLANLVLLKILDEKDNQFIASGPYRLEEVKPLEINLSPIASSAHLPLSLKIVRDETTLALKLINGEIDLSVANISPRKQAWLLNQRSNDLTLWRTEGTNTIYLAPNHARAPMNNLNMRKAISLLIPRNKIIEYKFRNSVAPSTGLFSKGFPAFHRQANIDAYDPKQAYELLSQEGYVRNAQGKWIKDGNPLVLDWKVTSNRATMEIVETMRHYLSLNGIDVRLTIQEWGIFMRSFRNGQFDLVMSQWMGFTGPEMLGFIFHSKNRPPTGANRGSFSNIEFDRIYDMASTESSVEKRGQLFNQAHDIANENYAYINLWHPEIRWIGKSCLTLPNLYSSGSFLSLIGLQNNCEK